MADGTINQDVQKNYLRAITINEKNIPSYKKMFSQCGEDLFDLVIEQNKKILQVSSRMYDVFNEFKEQSQNGVASLDAVLEQIKELKAGSGSGSSRRARTNNSGDHLSITFGEFDRKNDELEKKIKICDEKIDAEKKSLSINNDKIKDTKDYLQKFSLEKRLYLDKVDAMALRNKSKLYKIIKFYYSL